MWWPVPGGQGVDAPPVIGPIAGRRSPERLYWRLQRPRARVYARKTRRVVLYRAVAAAAAIAAIALCAFLGMVLGNINVALGNISIVLGNIGKPGWQQPITRLGTRALSRAVEHSVAQAVTEFAAWMPVFIVLGLVLAIIPRPRRWIFRLVMLGAGALGYCRRLLPPLPSSSAASAITGRTAAVAARLPLRPPAPAATVTVVLMLAVAAAYVCYRYSYGFAVRSTGIIPRRPATHYRSTFARVPVLQRLTAVPLAAAVLTAVAWIAEGIRAQLPGVRYGDFLFGYGYPSALIWSLAALIVAWAICMPHPNGYQWLFIVLLLGVTAYAFFPHVYLIRMPAESPTADGSFWALVVAYLGVTGFGYTAVASLLDWR
jgi:hypothetical protein